MPERRATAGSTVRFVSDNATTADVNLALINPADYSQANPRLAIPQLQPGSGVGNSNNAFVSFTYTGATGIPTGYSGSTGAEVPREDADFQTIGTAWGVAYQRSTKRLFTSALTRRHSGFGPRGADGIYILDYTNASSASVVGGFDLQGVTPANGGSAIDLGSVTRTNVAGTISAGAAGNNQLPSNPANPSIDLDAFAKVSKTSFGDIELTEDGTTLWAVNLNQRTLISIDVSNFTPNTTNPATPPPTNQYSLVTGTGTATAIGGAPSCTNGILRPWGLKFKDGFGYLGAVCSGESGGTAANLRGYVLRFNPASLSSGFTSVVDFALNYTKEASSSNSFGPSQSLNPWHVWTDTYTAGTIVNAQPIISNIEFTENGSMVLGLMDRFANQTDLDNYQAISGTTNLQGNTLGGGDILHFCNNAGNFVVEGTTSGSFTCTENDTGQPADTNPSGGANGNYGALSNDGPGGTGEFYYTDYFDGLNSTVGTQSNHLEVSEGGLAVKLGTGEVINTTWDPVRQNDANTGIFTQGIQFYSNTTGARADQYQIVPNSSTSFQKSNGLGDIELLADAAPIEIGNRVWRDANNNGVQDPSESRVGSDTVSLAGITVRLYNSANVLVGTAVTDLDGEYYFTSGTTADPNTNDNIGIVNGGILPNSTYQIRFDNAANFATGGVLAGLVPTRANATQQAGVDDASDSDAVRVVNPINSPTTGTFPVITYTTSTAGTNDHTLDAGFAVPVSIGSTVFDDTNNNGVQNTGEAGISGVTVELLYDANNDGLINGAELTTPLTTTVTSTGTGAALGNYFFGGLTPGNYQIRIPTPPSTATLSSTVTTTTDNQVDNDDNGTQTGGAGGSTISPIINLTVGAEPLNAAETGQGGTLDDTAGEANGDMTVDFGFLAPATIGDRVFNDLDRNGRQDAGEPGIDGVTVTLYDSSNNPIATTATATVGVNAGQYSFTGLAPGTYSVGFTLPTGFGYAFTLQDAGIATDSTDSDVNPTTGRTGTYTLTAGLTNNTVDAGLVQTLSLGNQVFNDTNNDGIRNGVEVGIVGATVNLYLDADDNNIADGGAIASTPTGANGLYLFTGLAPNNYIVGVVTPTNFVSSSVNGGDPDNNADNDDNGITVVGNETRSNSITLALTAEPTGEIPGNDANTPDNNSNLTLDFGFTTSYSIGNRVWFDTNNDGQINNVAGNVEVGASGVSVSVFASTDLVNALNSALTDANGYYRFDNLVAGTYVVRINPSNFANGGVLAGYQNTAGNNAADLDSTSVAGQNGEDGINPTGTANTIQTNGILSSVITLAAPEPTGEADVVGGTVAGQGTADNQANMTIDFGFYQMNLSGTVWNDNGGGGSVTLRDNGTINANEIGIANVQVRLYSGTTEILVGADGVLGTSDDLLGGVATTNSSGNYNFQGLPPGTYRVVVTAPTGGTSSSPASADPNLNADNDDNGFPDNTGNFPGRIISGTITLAPGAEVSFDNAAGRTLNPTVDFGFVFANPTLVQMDKFDAYTDGGSVELKWSTGNEVGNLGFNVYREMNGKRQLLNSAPIAGNALRSGVQLQASGIDYSWTDKSYSPNAVYYLEDLDINGSVNMHGSVVPQFRQKLGNQPNARMFSDLATVENTATREVFANQTLSNPNTKDLAAAAARQLQIAALGGAKITVNRDGWYRITAQQLHAAGFNTNSNPQLWQLFTDGVEVPFKLNSNSIEFFGRGTNTQLTDKRVYYLVNAQKTGLRINAVNGGAVEGTADAQNFGVTVERKDRAIYVSALVNGEDNENWFGAVVNRGGQTVQNLNVVNVDPNGRARLSVKLQGIVTVDHYVSVKFNDLDLGTVELGGLENKQFDFEIPSASVFEGVNRVYLQAYGAGNDVSLVDSIRLSYQRGYTAADNQIRFKVAANQTVRVNGFTDENISVYEIRNGAAVQQVVGASENSEGTYGFSLSAANVEREMIAVTASSVEQATVETNLPSAWNNAANKADFVIITSGELRDSANALAAMREAQGLQTKIVLVDDLFDEFTFGKRDPLAVKQFLQTAATRWQRKPKYALLFGDASYDTRNNLGLPQTRDIVPTKLVDTEAMETSSDAWLADFDNDGAEDIALGRLPVGNASEAESAIEKLARFDNQKSRQQKTNVLVADNGFEGYSAEMQSLLPADVNSIRIDRSAMTDAEMRQNIIARLNSNPMLVTYTGHGSIPVWISAGIFNQTDAAGLNNNELSFYLLMNCLNGYTNQPTGDSLAETLFKSPNSAIAVWTSSGITGPETQSAISLAFTRYAFDARTNGSLRIGDLVKAAKRATPDSDVRRTWQLVGDPTVLIK